MDMGNIYSAALPAWIAAGLEEALQTGRDLTGRNLLATGYGSGDAAEAIPMTAVEGWQQAAAKIKLAEAFLPYKNLSQRQYEMLHASGHCDDLCIEPKDEFIVDAIGSSVHPAYADQGIEYYRYVN